jgi:hypothetical protein
MESRLRLDAKLHGMEYKARAEAPKIDENQRELINKMIAARMNKK